jgi:hypothetical protein
VGQELSCTAVINGRPFQGKALLETDALIFRGENRVTILFKEMSFLEAKDGQLYLSWPKGEAILHLGNKAEDWERRIRNPKGLLDKLGIKEGFAVSVLGVMDAEFLQQLEERVGRYSRGKASPGSDAVFLEVERREGLQQLKGLSAALKKNGAFWVLWPKGRLEIKESDVMAAAKEVGLVDVKVVKFSESHSALKLVIPVAKR